MAAPHDSDEYYNRWFPSRTNIEHITFDDLAWIALPRKMTAADIGLGEPFVVFPLDSSCEGTLWR